MTAAPRADLEALPAAEFDVAEFRRMAADAVEKADSPDPLVATDLLLSALTDEQCRLALRVTMPNWMRNLIGGVDRKVRQEPASRPMTTPQRVTVWYQRVLRTRVLAGEEWKFLADCTSRDLNLAAGARFRAAAATQAEGLKMQALAALMEQDGLEVVADVPAEALKAVYS